MIACCIVQFGNNNGEHISSRKMIWEYFNLPNKVTFRRTEGEDPDTERFLREWLDDIAAIDAGENSSILKFPPILPDSKR